MSIKNEIFLINILWIMVKYKKNCDTSKLYKIISSTKIFLEIFAKGIYHLLRIQQAVLSIDGYVSWEKI